VRITDPDDFRFHYYRAESNISPASG
jgi:hypothetical protein